MTVLVQGTWVVEADEKVISDDRIAFKLLGSSTALPTRLVDAGTIHVRETADGVHAIGVLAASALLGDRASFEISPGGSLVVSSDGAAGRAYAVLANRLPEFINAGSVRVSAAQGEAMAIVMGDFLGGGPIVHIANQGAITAVGDYALGINAYGGVVENSGSITAHGSLLNNYGVSLFGPSALVNSGIIAAHALDRTGGAVGVIIDVVTGGPNSILNTGEIRAPVAVEAHNFSDDGEIGLTLNNSGLIRGDVRLSTGADFVLNTGRIAGLVDLSDGDDRFEGRYGAGSDTVIGGGGSDWMAAGHGDAFLFRFVGESTPSNPDIVLNVDKSVIIDLSAIDADIFDSGDQRFHLVERFSHRAGELVVRDEAESGLATVEGDVNGDGQADIAIQLQGSAAAHFDNFVF